MNTPPIITGNAGPNMPDYISNNAKEVAKESNHNRIPQSSQSLNPGVILTTDSLEVPLEYAFSIADQRSESSRPSLMPLFRTRYVDKALLEDLSIDYYVQLRNALPAHLKEELEADEQLAVEKRDSNLVALDHSLHFEADVLLFAKKLSSSPLDPDQATLAAQVFHDLPTQTHQALLNHEKQVISYLDRHLESIGPNDPSYDIFLNASNQLKEAWNFLNSY